MGITFAVRDSRGRNVGCERTECYKECSELAKCTRRPSNGEGTHTESLLGDLEFQSRGQACVLTGQDEPSTCVMADALPFHG